MKIKKIILSSLLVIIIAALSYGIYYCSVSFPIVSGYGAKNMCSAVFLAGRSEQQEREQELGFSPMTLGTFTVDYKDSSVTGSVFGFAKRKAIYRTGLGATLINELSENEVRNQKFRLAVKPFINTDTIAWPMGDKINAVIDSSIDMLKLNDAVENIFVEKDTANPIRTRAVVVLHDGNIVAEQYANGFTKDTKLIGWSMTKSITSALTGILVKQGKLQVDAPAPVAEWKDANDPRHQITLKNILQQTTGLDFLEDYTKSSDATKMLFQKAAMGTYTASHEAKDKPGTVFYYSSGNTNLLSRIIRETVGENDYHAFPYEQLFYKLGMYNTIMEPDASGTFVGSSYSYGVARDWARFGLLYLNDGVYNGERLLPDGWVKQTATPSDAAKKGEYGYHFWLNAGAKNDPANRSYPHCPADMYCCDGYEGQFVFIIPSKNLVIVRLGLTQHDNFDADKFVADVVASVK
ncbi:serine hydrolase [Panacibacter ginsenosidivorans]|uniref:Serine hydrolase n=1 Tax=Panacibacter ginsenosidivorans TaxID=1813871 RepID=A0A5B8VFC7_9BACT|nr:serine hydrolase [Panacibacter ginsenosidivorans]QEC69048.1 serine hydrolase [Panacibacter ginsenosidivorans]